MYANEIGARMRIVAGIGCASAVALGLWLAAGAQETASQGRSDAAFSPEGFIEANCIECHNEEASTAMSLFSGLFLDRVDVHDIASDPVVGKRSC